MKNYHVMKRLLPSGIQIFLVILLTTGLGLGCASSTKTTKTETTTIAPQGTALVSPEQTSGEATVVEQERTTTTETTETDDHSGGVLSTIVDGIGFVISLPFRIVGGLVSAIF
jgi:hypothetical protein